MAAHRQAWCWIGIWEFYIWRATGLAWAFGNLKAHHLSNSATSWWPNGQIYEPMGTILIQITIQVYAVCGLQAICSQKWSWMKPMLFWNMNFIDENTVIMSKVWTHLLVSTVLKSSHSIHHGIWELYSFWWLKMILGYECSSFLICLVTTCKTPGSIPRITNKLANKKYSRDI